MGSIKQDTVVAPLQHWPGEQISSLALSCWKCLHLPEFAGCHYRYSVGAAYASPACSCSLSKRSGWNSSAGYQPRSVLQCPHVFVKLMSPVEPSCVLTNGLIQDGRIGIGTVSSDRNCQAAWSAGDLQQHADGRLA